MVYRFRRAVVVAAPCGGRNTPRQLTVGWVAQLKTAAEKKSRAERDREAALEAEKAPA